MPVFFFISLLLAGCLSTGQTTEPPNIVLILADDLGYGDVRCYNPESKVPTPHLDRLAAAGMRFTDAHSPSTVCTPSRYSLLTGKMAFRINYRGVFTGVGGPCLITKAQLTLPQLLREKGYATAMFGKWHVGMSFPAKGGGFAHEKKVVVKEKAAWPRGPQHVARVQLADWSKPIPDGPVHRGFDDFFGTACCPTTDWLYAFIDGDRVPNPPANLLDRKEHGLPVHPYSQDNRIGLIADDFDLEEVDMLFLKKSVAWLEKHAEESADRPFFLFHSAQAVHLPSFAGDAFKEKSGAGPHGDFIFEFDFIVGELMETLQRLGMAENTLVIVSSDNGPETGPVVAMRRDHDHDGARPWRGMKRDNWEGGHRVPFIASWPGKIEAGSVSDETICLTDIMATSAALTGYQLPNESAEDSFNLLPALLGEDTGDGIRPYTLHQTISLALAIRKGKWKYLDHKGSGGNRYENREGLAKYILPEKAPDAPGQLYNMETDPGETNNLYFEHPEAAKELKTLLEQSKAAGRSAPERSSFASAAPVDFAKQLQPILEKKCLGCHNPNVSKGDLSLAHRDKILASEHHWIVPGSAQQSKLWQVVTPGDSGEKPEMPEEGEALTDAERDLLSRWINQGATWPDGLVLHEASKTDKSWWAYQKLARPKHNSIDRFIDEKLAAAGLKKNGEADRRTLIRRATYDLTGLPPSPAEVEAFVASKDPEAYEKLIDRLLASPRYGERWGRHWLDVVRFGESNGFERNFIINELWPFRDYVINSINSDKPFDQLIREHLAGDVLGKDNPSVAIGSAFLVAGPYDDVGNQDPKAKAQIRANTLDEIIIAAGEAFLGMTLGCARCHDHKFDPISQRDYYQMYSTFSGIRHGGSPLATAEQKTNRQRKLKPLQDNHSAASQKKSALEKAIMKRAQGKLPEYEKNWTRPKVDRTGTGENFPPVKAKFVRLVCDASDANPKSKTFRIDEFEIWTAGSNPRNVALASDGAKATGAARINEDFPGVYGPQLAIDGQTGRRFISTSNQLTIELRQPEVIERVIFSSARGEEIPQHGKFAFVGDYRIEVSLDGEKWRAVASGADRKPASNAHRDHRLALLETSSEESARLTGLAREIRRLDGEMKKIPPLPVAWMGTRNAQDAKGPFHVFVGGNPQRKGEKVLPASLSTLSEVAPSYELPENCTEDQRRLHLANWITHSENPLPARVLANRLWHYHFGTGIVDTPNDFGYMGGRPTHPGLLDFLAEKLVENDWKIKAMHRLIMLSDAYRQSSQWRAEAAEIDGGSRLLWRFPPRRLSAEEIRDTILAVSGKLDLKMGGPGFRLYKYMQDNVSTYEPLDSHGPETYRRAVYHQNARASVVDLMTEFDQPDCALSSPRRARTTTPLQALTMLNHQFTIDMANSFADRLRSKEPAGQATEIFRIAYQREPTAGEKAKAAEAIAEAGPAAACRAVLNSSELIYLD